MGYQVPRCPGCSGPALRERSQAENAALTLAAFPGGTLRCGGCGHTFPLDRETEWVPLDD